MNEIIQMGVKLFEANKKPESLKFSIEESNKIFTDKLIKESMEYAGLKYTSGQKMSFETYSHPLVKHKLFNLISQSIEAIVPKYLMNQYDRFIDIRNAAWGDKLYIEVTSPDLFTVSKVSHGNVNVRRQKLDRRSISLAPIMREVKVYEDLYRLLAGRVDWATYVNKVSLSLANDIHTDAYTAFYDSYDATDSTYFASGAFSGTTFNTMAEHVKVANGGVPVQAWGTKLALAKINAHTGFTAYPGLNSQNMLDEFHKMGHYGSYQGTDLVRIDQAHTANTNDFAISDSFIIITPVGSDKPIKLGFEGQAIFGETASRDTQDQDLSFNLQKSWDLQLLSAGRFGIYRIT